MNYKKILIFASVLVVAMTLLQPLSAIQESAHGLSIQVAPDVGSSHATYPGNLTSSSGSVSSYSGNFTAMNSISGIPAKYQYLPNLHPSLSRIGNAYLPSYTTSPAPMGVADYGVKNTSGTLTSYSYSTTSFEGTVSVGNMTPLYALNDAPQSLSIQLNAILKNVDIGGSAANTFWTQNVLYYSARLHQVQLIDNVWNFSSPNATMNNSTLSSHGANGTLVPGSLYYALGPAINVTYPFTASLYLNSTLNGSSDQVFFNYSISMGAKKQITGSFDNVTFNTGTPQSSPASYYISGSQLAPIGGIPYDAEFVIGGPGGGSTTSLYGLNATMDLKYLSANSGKYSNVQSAYDAGSSTGETANGIAVSWNGEAVAKLSAGPSMVYGMWNISQASMVTYTGSISPSSSFLFVDNASVFQNSTASWSPLNSTGSYNFTLPSGTYSMAIISNWHTPMYERLSQHVSVVAQANLSAGIYAPIYVFGNSQAAGISSGGQGTEASPYIITGVQNSTIMPIFGKFNDYGFPVFSGILASGITSHVTFDRMPSFYIYYPQQEFPFLNYFGLPSINYLNIEFYNDSNITLTNSSFISGWFSSNLAGYFPAANLLLWNTTNSLVASNYFSGMDSSLLVYNDNSTASNNTIWGNYFGQDTLASTTVYYAINTLGAPTGLSVYSSGNLVYNNEFVVYNPVTSLNFSIYSGLPVNYTNTWNITRVPLSYTKVVLGTDLTGGILSSGPNAIEYQAGNYWWNYLGNGAQVYNNSGLISSGGDAAPLIKSVYGVGFNETGLPVGMTWYVVIDNGTIAVGGTGRSIQFYEPNGTYYIQLYAGRYIANQSSGLVIVSGTKQSFDISFSLTYLLQFMETGLPENTPWNVTVNGVAGSSTGNTIAYLATNGSFTYSLGSVEGYYPTASAGSFNLIGKNTTVDISFLPFSFPVSIAESGLQSGTQWGMFINGQQLFSSSSTLSLNLPNGTYEYTIIGAKGYNTGSQYGSLKVNNGSYSGNIAFTPENFTLTFTQKGLPTGMTWSVTVGGKTLKSTNSSISLNENTSTYNFSINAPSGYKVSQPTGVVDVNANISVPVTFSKAGSISLYQALDYGLFVVSVLVLLYAVYYVRRKR